MPDGMGKLGGMGGNMQKLEKILGEIQKTESEYINEDHHPMFKLGAASIATEIKQIIYEHMNDNWIAVEEKLPENNDYILLSFDNCEIPIIGRYEDRREGGAFYLGDCTGSDTCVAQDLYVTAWMPLPEPYRPELNEEEEMQEWKERMLRNFMKKGEM